jgi:hypothetical protein
MRTAGSIMAWPALQQHLRDLDDLVYSADDNTIRRKLAQIVPEYHYTEPLPAALDVAPVLLHNAALQIAATASAND